MATPAATGLTVADLYRLPDDGRRYELVDGRLFVTPLARRRHQWVVTRISHRLMGWTERHGGTVYAGVNVDLDDDTHLEPDVVFSRSEDTSGLAFEAAPDIVVEVSSPSTKSFDLGIKKDRYAAEGAREFWFVDLDTDVIRRFVLADGRYGPAEVAARGQALTTPLLSGLLLDVDDLLGAPETTGR